MCLTDRHIPCFALANLSEKARKSQFFITISCSSGVITSWLTIIPILPIVPIVPVKVSHPMLFAPVAASSGHLFLDAAIFQEILLVLFQQPPQQEICLMNQHQRNVVLLDFIKSSKTASTTGTETEFPNCLYDQASDG